MQRKSMVKLVAAVVAIPLAITTFSSTAMAISSLDALEQASLDLENNHRDEAIEANEEGTAKALVRVTSDQTWTPESSDTGSIGAVGEGQSVTYTGDINATDDVAAYAADGGVVTVIGNVSTTMSPEGMETHDSIPTVIADNGTVNISGSVLIPDNGAAAGYSAIEFKGNSNINISGADSVIQAGAQGVAIYLDQDTHNGIFTANSSFDVNGTSIAILAGEGAHGIDETNITEYLPEINVFRIFGDANSGVCVYADEFDVDDPDKAQAMEDAVLHHINYIIHSDPLIGIDANNSSTGNATVIDSIRSVTTKYVSPEELEANPDAGFLAYLSSDYELKVENNSDGWGSPIARITPLDTVTADGKKVYRVTLIHTYGGLTLSAIRKQIADTTGVSESEVAIEIEAGTAENAAPAEASPASTSPFYGAITVLPRSSWTAANGAVFVPDRAVFIKTLGLPDTVYKNTVIENIGATPAGGIFRMETDSIACFDRAMLEAFAKKGNVSMEVIFPLGKTRLRAIIPAGTDINELLDAKGYCGFLRLIAIVGAEEIH